MLRRNFEAIVAAHAMDPARRELYVEGPRDRLFLSWLLSDQMDPDASVREIGAVDIPDPAPAGERGRLFAFANWLDNKNVRIRFFADADWDRLLSRSVPNRIWLTDFRDMEGYLLRVECVDKVLRLGVGTEKVVATQLIKAVREHSRRLGLVRLMSEVDSLSLPFQKTRLVKYVSVSGERVNVNLDHYLRALVQNAGLSIALVSSLKQRLQSLETQYAATPDGEIIHGKDAISILQKVLLRFGVQSKEAPRLLWTSFETGFVKDGSKLSDVAQFLSIQPRNP